MKARLVISATLLAGALSSNARASEEDQLVWKTVQIAFGESPETNKIALNASADKNGLTALEITAFGYTFSPTPEQLAAIKEFPLESLRVTREAGYEKTGGPVIHFKFQHEYYDKVSKLLLIREEAILSVTKAGISISVKPKKS